MLARLHISRALAAAASAIAVLSVCQAFAQNLDPVAATELFSQGRDALKDGDFDRACRLFAESNRLDPKVGTLLNLGECEEKRYHFAEALQAWQQAVNLAQATNDPRAEIAADRLATLTPRVPRLTVRVSRDSPSGTRVYRDDVELGEVMLGQPFPVDPGDHRVVAVSPSGMRRTFHVRLKEGDATEIAVAAPTGAPVPSSSAAQSLQPPPASRGNKRTFAYALGGVGLAGVATGIVTGAMLMSRKKTVDDHCSADGACDPTGADAADSGKTLVPINTVAWAIGALGLGAGAYFYVTATPTTSSRGASSNAAPTGAVIDVVGRF